MTLDSTNEIRSARGRILRHSLSMIAFGCGAFAAVFVMTGLFPQAHILCELSSHFYVQYLVVLMICVTGLFLCRRWQPALCLTPFLLFCLWQVVPYYLPAAQANQTAVGRLKLVQVNVNSANNHYTEVIDYVRATDPDVVCFEEVTLQWSNKLTQGLQNLYPYRFCKPLENTFGIAMFSKLPFDAVATRNLANYDFPTIVADVQLQKKPVTIVCAHTLPPTSDSLLHARGQQMDALARIKSNKDQRVIILGDLNCSCWNPDFRRMLKGMDGVDSQVGFGVQASWPSFFPLIWTNIDHLVTTDHFVTVNRRIGPYIGSDHFPVCIEEALVK